MKYDNSVIALDLGSTNISAVLLNEGVNIYKETFLNPQMRYGSDIMTRIKKCTDGKSAILHKILLERLKLLIEKINAMGYYPQKMIVSGNTVMLHILYDCDCSGMGVAPYTPIFTEAKCEKSTLLGLVIQSLPCVAAFCGGDVIAGILAAGMPCDGKNNILIDLGTNAEIAVWNNKKGLLTSAAAGPCFCDGKMKGTELIDFISELLKRKQIYDSGTLVNGKETFSHSGQRITQKRIRDFQLAKAAVRTALDIIIEYACLSEDDVETVYISGGFSEKISIDNAVLCGLLPSNLKNKCLAIGNSSLDGAIKVAQGANASIFAEKCKYISLNNNPSFNQKFIDNMCFEDIL